MKSVIEKVIRKRNPNFRFDEAVTTCALVSLFLEKSIWLFRGWRSLLRLRKPKMLLLGKGVKFTHLGNISWGKWVKLEDRVHLSALGKGKLSLGNHVGIGAYSRVIISTSFSNVGSHITIGNNVGIGEFAYLGGGGGLDIGDDCIIGQYFSCHPENHEFGDTTQLIREQGVSRQGISIGPNCWIGSKVTILDGVNIGEGCVIAAGAVVTQDMPANTVVGGVPARALKQRTTLQKEVA